MSTSIYNSGPDTPDPIKRSWQLAPFSREHHDGLLLVWKIGQGIKLGIEVKRIGAYCGWFWENDLHPHFKREEIALEIVLPKNHPLRVRAEEEHEVIEAKLGEMKYSPTVEGLESLAAVLRDHIRFEERTLFNYIQEVSTGEQLELVYAIINIERRSNSVWSMTQVINAGNCLQQLCIIKNQKNEKDSCPHRFFSNCRQSFELCYTTG